MNAKLRGDRKALLAFNGRLLENYETIYECGIKHNDKLDLYSLYFINSTEKYEAGIKEYDQYWTIRQVKERVAENFERAADDLRFIWWGVQLEDNRTLSDYNITKGAIIWVVLRLRAVGHCDNIEMSDVQTPEVPNKKQRDSCVVL